MIDLSKRAALVTGGARGIGRQTALLLARAGADVSLSYLSRADAAAEVVQEIEALGRRAIALRADAASRADMQEVFTRTEEVFGRLDIVVANAGIWKRAPIDEMSEEQWDETINANLRSVYLVCHFAARIMKRQGSGSLILVSSTAGQRGEPFYSHYAASKGAVIALTKSLAAELGPAGIRVNCIAPGWVRTDMTAEVFADPAFTRSVERGIPVGRIASPEQIASVALFLASDLASHVQGEVVNVNGGSVLCG